MNNKGFAVSSVLYALLIAFLMFLGVLLAMYSSSNSLISNSNKDLVDDLKLTAIQVKPVIHKEKDEVCPETNKDHIIIDWEKAWYKPDNNIILKITTRYGIIYWPRNYGTLQADSTYNNIRVQCLDCDDILAERNATNIYNVKIIDELAGDNITVQISNLCE